MNHQHPLQSSIPIISRVLSFCDFDIVQTCEYRLTSSYWCDAIENFSLSEIWSHSLSKKPELTNNIPVTCFDSFCEADSKARNEHQKVLQKFYVKFFFTLIRKGDLWLVKRLADTIFASSIVSVLFEDPAAVHLRDPAARHAANSVQYAIQSTGIYSNYYWNVQAASRYNAPPDHPESKLFLLSKLIYEASNTSDENPAALEALRIFFHEGIVRQSVTDLTQISAYAELQVSTVKKDFIGYNVLGWKVPSLVPVSGQRAQRESVSFLALACIFGNVDVVRLLVEGIESLVEAIQDKAARNNLLEWFLTTKEHSTLLQSNLFTFAAMYNRKDVLHFLVSKLKQLFTERFTPLYNSLADEKKRQEIIQNDVLTMLRSTIYQSDSHGKGSAPTYAILYDNLDCFRILAEECNLLDPVSETFDVPCMSSFCFRSWRLLPLLHRHEKATALMTACCYNKTEVAEYLLLEYYSKNNNESLLWNNENYSPFEVSMQHWQGGEKLVKLWFGENKRGKEFVNERIVQENPIVRKIVQDLIDTPWLFGWCDTLKYVMEKTNMRTTRTDDKGNLAKYLV